MSTAAGADDLAGRGNIRIGISSWASLPGFYPSGVKPSEKLTWYARFFSVVEVNVSFYRLVPPRTYEQWIDATPPGFIFDVKAVRDLTHDRIARPGQTFAGFRESFQPLRDAGRLGGVLFQFPPRFADTPDARDYLARIAAEMGDDQVIVEFRNSTWLNAGNAPSTFAYLRDLGIAYAIADEPQFPPDTVPPLVAVTDPNLAYVRLHGRNAAGWRRGGGARYDYDYPGAELEEWKATVVELAGGARQVHVLFNNNARGGGTRNAIQLGQMLGIAPSDAPGLPLSQQPLFPD